MVSACSNPIDFFRSLRTEISINGLKSFKVFKIKEQKFNNKSVRKFTNKSDRQFKDSELATLCPED